MDEKRHVQFCSTSETLHELAIADGVEKEKAKEHNPETRSIRSLHSLSPSEHSTVADEEARQDAELGLERTLTPKQPIVQVPRSERRGLFARFAIVAEVTNPQDLPDKTKWSIVAVIGFAAAAAPVGSAIILRQFTHIGSR